MLTFPFNSDCKFTLIPKIDGVAVPREDMVNLSIRVSNINANFEPIWRWNDIGIEIEIQRENIRSSGEYKVSLDWRKPDDSFSDNFKDICNSCTVITFSRSCNIVSENTAVIEMSPEYKGEKGDPFTYDDFTEEQLNDLRQPAIDAAAIADEAAGLARQKAADAQQAAGRDIGR